jgi:1-acyl-sn-glycerol-3-phosphate acyltransferase
VSSGRAAWRAALLLGSALGLGLLQALLLAITPRRGAFLPRLFHRLAVRIVGLRVTVHGRPPETGAVLVVANHASWLDIPVIGVQVPARFVARADMRLWPGIGLLAGLHGSVFVDRMRRRGAAAAGAEIAERLRLGQTVVLFPEGTTSDGTRVLPFRSSLLGLPDVPWGGDTARAATIHPLAIVYTHRNGLPLTRREFPAIAWYGDMTLGPHLWQALKARSVDVSAIWGEPVAAPPAVQRKALARVLEQHIREAFSRARSGRPEFGATYLDETENPRIS